MTDVTRKRQAFVPSIVVLCSILLLAGSALATTVSISGQVTQNGSAVSGAWLDVFTDGDVWVANTQTDASGNYIFSSLDAGTYKVYAYAPGTGTQVAYTSNPLTVTTDTAGVDIVLPASYSLSGTVQQNGAAVSGVWLDVFTEADQWVKNTQTSTDGAYSFSNLANGNYKVYAYEPGSMTQTAHDSNPVAVSGANVTGIDITFASTYTISGTVTQGGSAASGVWLDVFDGDGRWKDNAQTSTDGTYTLGPVGAGTYSVYVYVPGPMTQTAYGSNPIALSSGNATNIDIDIAASYGLSGTVTRSGQAVSSAWVDVFTSANTWMQNTPTDASGNFSFSNLHAGSYNIYAYDPQNSNAQTAYSGNAVTISSANVADIDIVFAAGGKLMAWGSDSHGQLGSGRALLSKVQVSGLTGVTAVAAGKYHNLALKDDGTVWAWGDNYYGQLGDSTTVDRVTPVQVSGLSSVSAVAAGHHFSLALKDDGTVWAWGQNSYGQLGNGTTVNQTTPVQATGTHDVVTIAAGGSHCLAIKANRTLLSWGAGSHGQLGNGAWVDSPTPVAVTGCQGITAISAGSYHSLALKSDKTVLSWGWNANGELGNGSTTNRSTAVAVLTLTDIASIRAGGLHSLAVKADGSVWTWGTTIPGQTDDIGTIDRTIPNQVQGISNVAVAWLGGGGELLPHDFVFSDCALVLKTDGTAWGWGNNLYGQLGDGTTDDPSAPVAVADITDIAEFALGWCHTIALKSDGTVWSWGLNSSGQLGDGQITYEDTPLEMTSLSDLVAVEAGAWHSVALKADGTLWAWGGNLSGQLGDGTTVGNATPGQVPALSGVSAIAVSERHNLAVTSDRTVWSWGSNSNGQLGDGTMTDQPSPSQVPGLVDVLAVAAGAYHSIAVKVDGTVWAWGSNSSGQLGDGTTENRTSPVQLTGLSGVIGVAASRFHSLAVKSDGTVWAWGHNGSGQLGNGTKTDQLAPVQVTGISDAIAVSAHVGWWGIGGHSLALRSDGTIWAWGNNNQGQLGDGTTTSSLTPVQVSGISDVVAIAAIGRPDFASQSMAVKSDGTVWTWGDGSHEDLSNAESTDDLTPVQLSGISGATDIASSGNHYLVVVE